MRSDRGFACPRPPLGNAKHSEVPTFKRLQEGRGPLPAALPEPQQPAAAVLGAAATALSHGLGVSMLAGSGILCLAEQAGALEAGVGKCLCQAHIGRAAGHLQ